MSPMHSMGSLVEGTNPKLATSPLPSQRPTSGQNCYVSPAFSGLPKKGDKTKSGYISLAFSRAQKWAELLCKPFVL